MLIVSASGSIALARRVADRIGARMVEVNVKRFPDGEIYIRAEKPLNEEIVLIGNSYPNDSLVELLLLQDLIYDLTGKRDFYTVIPYFGYGRQDRRFLNGECVSSKACADLLELKCGRIITINLHKDAIRDYFKKAAIHNLVPSRELSELSRDTDIVVSPDEGSFYLAESVAREIGVDCAHFDKKRVNDREVESSIESDVEGKKVLIVDDIISTGTTIINASRILKNRGAAGVEVACVHGLFAEGAAERIKKECISLNASDTIESCYTNYSVSESIAKKIKEG